jgi:hypothetical protein
MNANHIACAELSTATRFDLSVHLNITTLNHDLRLATGRGYTLNLEKVVQTNRVIRSILHWRFQVRFL